MIRTPLTLSSIPFPPEPPVYTCPEAVLGGLAARCTIWNRNRLSSGNSIRSSR